MPLQRLMVLREQEVQRMLPHQTLLPQKTKKLREKEKRLHLLQRRRERRIRNVKRRRTRVLTLARR